LEDKKVKPSVPYLKILRRVENPAVNERDTSSANFTAISRKGSAPLLLGVFAGYCQRFMVDESGMIKIQVGKAK
jgi:hypothetical protein